MYMCIYRCISPSSSTSSSQAALCGHVGARRAQEHRSFPSTVQGSVVMGMNGQEIIKICLRLDWPSPTVSHMWQSRCNIICCYTRGRCVGRDHGEGETNPTVVVCHVHCSLLNTTWFLISALHVPILCRTYQAGILCGTTTSA
jgi:hypothetical protein